VRKTFTEREVRFVIHGFALGPGQFPSVGARSIPSVWSRCGNGFRKVLARLEQQLEDRRFLVHHNSVSPTFVSPRASPFWNRLGVQLPSSSVNLQAWINSDQRSTSTQGLKRKPTRSTNCSPRRVLRRSPVALQIRRLSGSQS